MSLVVQSLAIHMVRVHISTRGCVLDFFEVRSFLMEEIQAHRFDDVRLRVLWDKVLSGEDKEASLDPGGALKIKGLVYVKRGGD